MLSNSCSFYTGVAKYENNSNIRIHEYYKGLQNNNIFLIHQQKKNLKKRQKRRRILSLFKIVLFYFSKLSCLQDLFSVTPTTVVNNIQQINPFKISPPH